MSCTQTLSNINVDCGANKGGVVELLAQTRSAVASITVTDGKVTAITMADTTPPAAKFAFRKQASGLTSTLNIDQAAGVKFVSSEMAMRFAKMDTSKRTAIQAMSDSELYCIVKDENGKYWLLGYDNPVTISAGTGATGTAFTDANEYTITLSDTSNEFPYEVAESAVASFLNEA